MPCVRGNRSQFELLLLELDEEFEELLLERFELVFDERFEDELLDRLEELLEDRFEEELLERFELAFEERLELRFELELLELPEKTSGEPVMLQSRSRVRRRGFAAAPVAASAAKRPPANAVKRRLRSIVSSPSSIPARRHGRGENEWRGRFIPRLKRLPSSRPSRHNG